MRAAASRCALMLVAMAAGAWAQDFAGKGYSIDGQITSEGAASLTALSAVIEGSETGVTAASAIDATGAFHFDGLQGGAYQLRIVNRDGSAVASQIVFVNAPGTGVSIALRNSQPSAPAGAVSVRALAHKPSRAAVHAFQASQRARQKGDVEKWAAKLRQTIALDPQYAPAVHDLGLYYLTTKRVPEAIEQFRAALVLDPSSAAAHRNLAAALGQLGRYSEAEQHLRTALQLDPASARGRYLMGVLYLLTGRTSDALKLLQPIAGEIPQARELVSRLQSASK